MHAYRRTRLGWAAISNGLLLVISFVSVLRASNDFSLTLVAVTVATLCILGFALEIVELCIAAVLNIGLPTGLALLLSTAVFWLPMIGEPSEGAEGISPAYVLLLLSLAVASAAIHVVSYRKEHCDE